jgi:hypothetical protein
MDPAQTASPALFDTTDLVLLSAIGLGTAAWFSRRQLKDLLFGKKAEKTTPIAGSGTAQKRETNFVKVMEEQVRKRVRLDMRGTWCIHHLFFFFFIEMVGT